MVQEQIVRYRKRSVSPSAKLSNKLIRSVKSQISLPTDSPFFCEKSESQCKGRTLGEIKHRLIEISSYCYIKILLSFKIYYIIPIILKAQRLYLHWFNQGLFVCFSHIFFLHFFKGNFDNAVEILKPIRYKIVKIGGSNAQVRMWRVMFKSVEKELLIKFKGLFTWRWGTPGR